MSQRAPLRDGLDEYLSLRRALGFKLKNAGRLLGQLVDYLQARGINTVTTQDAFAWTSLPAEASSHWPALRLSVVRGFATYLHTADPPYRSPRPGWYAAECAGRPHTCTPQLRSARSWTRRPNCALVCG